MGRSVLLQTLSHTPPWVFAVFVLLVFFGYRQSRGRTVGRAGLMALPLAMLCLSFYGVVSSFGLIPPPLLAWGLGLLLPVALGVRLLTPKDVIYASSGSFLVPGSWLPLVLMMAIFFVKYVVGFATARNLPMIHLPWFIASVSFAFGLFSGALSARGIGILRSA
jgi:hypothetical protein